MIQQPDEKNLIIQILGKHYSHSIKNHLEQKGIKPLEAQKWSITMIQKIVNGVLQHLTAEMEIFRFIEKQKKIKEKQLEIRNKLIQKIK